MTPERARAVLDLLAARDTQDSFERATGWAVLCAHDESPEMRTLYGPFAEPAAALEWAAGLERDLNTEGEEGFRCLVLPIMPAT